MYVAQMLDLMTLYTTQRKQYVRWSDQSNYRVGSQQGSRKSHKSQELSFVEEFRYLGHVMTPYCRDDKDINKQFIRQKCSWEYADQEVHICTY